MDLDATTLCRLQFGLTASYHVIFPSLIIGLTGYLLFSAVAGQVRRSPAQEEQFGFWSRMLVPVFVLAVGTGSVLAYQLDHVFTGFYGLTTAVLVPIRHTEVMASILLEAGCFAIMVWGRSRVGDRLHLLATCLFAAGVATAAVCILGRNSWMHTPAGYAFVDGKIRVTDWFAAIFNPSFPYRLVHMVGAACVSTALVVLAICSWYLLRGRHREFARFGLRHAVLVVGILAPLQILSGDLHGLETRDRQPVKLAAMEALWETQRGAPLVLFGVPDPETEQNRWELSIPRLASLVITHDADGEIEGLREVPPEDRPNVPLVFAAFRVMVASGLAILGIGVVGLVLLRRGRLFECRWFLRLGCCAFPLGFVATIAGWCVTEAGRQPWLVQGLVRTADAVDRVPAEGCAASLPAIGLAYLFLSLAFVTAIAWIVYRGPGVSHPRTPRVHGTAETLSSPG